MAFLHVLNFTENPSAKHGGKRGCRVFADQKLNVTCGNCLLFEFRTLFGTKSSIPFTAVVTTKDLDH